MSWILLFLRDLVRYSKPASKSKPLKYFLLIPCLVLVLSACTPIRKLVRQHQEVELSTVNNNLCKRLRGKVVLYAIFVDSKYTHPWTTYDMNSTLDSIRLGMDWIEAEARALNIPLEIEVAHHQDDRKTIPIEGNLARKTLMNTLLAPYGIRNVDRWADKIGKVALKTFGPDTSTVTKTKIKPKNRERLVARLRDQYKTDNVALIYFINNYFTREISVALHTAASHDPEYAVVSFKKPAVVIHEFLHLFGALDLYHTPFDNKRKVKKQKAFAMKEFPREIMAFTHKDLCKLEIGPITQYLIGWRKELSPAHQALITSKRFRLAKY